MAELKPMYDYSKLNGKIKEVYRTQEAFAKKIGIGTVSLNKRLNNKLEFSQTEMLDACEALGVEKEEIPTYFFTPKV